MHLCSPGQHTHHLKCDASRHAPGRAEGCWEVEQPRAQAGIDNDEDSPKRRSGACAWAPRRGVPLILGSRLHTGTLQQAGPLPGICAHSPLAVVTVDADLGHGPRSPLLAGDVGVLPHDHIPWAACSQLLSREDSSQPGWDKGRRDLSRDGEDGAQRGQLTFGRAHGLDPNSEAPLGRTLHWGPWSGVAETDTCQLQRLLALGLWTHRANKTLNINEEH